MSQTQNARESHDNANLSTSGKVIVLNSFNAGVLPSREPAEAQSKTVPGQTEGSRTLQNCAALVVLLLLILGGWFLISHLRESLRLEACIESGFRNCTRIELGR